MHYPSNGEARSVRIWKENGNSGLNFGLQGLFPKFKVPFGEVSNIMADVKYYRGSICWDPPVYGNCQDDSRGRCLVVVLSLPHVTSRRYEHLPLNHTP